MAHKLTIWPRTMSSLVTVRIGKYIQSTTVTRSRDLLQGTGRKHTRRNPWKQELSRAGRRQIVRESVDCRCDSCLCSSGLLETAHRKKCGRWLIDNKDDLHWINHLFIREKWMGESLLALVGVSCRPYLE